LILPKWRPAKGADITCRSQSKLPRRQDDGTVSLATERTASVFSRTRRHCTVTWLSRGGDVLCAPRPHVLREARRRVGESVTLRSGLRAKNEDRPPAWHRAFNGCRMIATAAGALCQSRKGQCLSEPACRADHEDAAGFVKAGNDRAAVNEW